MQQQYAYTVHVCGRVDVDELEKALLTVLVGGNKQTNRLMLLLGKWNLISMIIIYFHGFRCYQYFVVSLFVYIILISPRFVNNKNSRDQHFIYRLRSCNVRRTNKNVFFSFYFFFFLSFCKTMKTTREKNNVTTSVYLCPK